VIRFVFLGTHYSKPMDWTEKKAEEAERTLTKWYRQVGLSQADEPYRPVVDALADDLNTHEALTHCYALSNAGDVSGLRGSLRLLGLLADSIPEWARLPGFSDEEMSLIRDLLQRRDNARAQKDWHTADVIRDGLTDAGVIVRDTKGGEPEFEKASNFDMNRLDFLWGTNA
jgi:cysteinyl-tRNA synthetase